MPSTKDEYEKLLARLLDARAFDGEELTEDEQDGLLDKLDELWWAMTEEERCSFDSEADTEEEPVKG